MGRGAVSGALYRSCPNCFEGLRIVAGEDPGISLLGRKVWEDGPDVKATPQADGDSSSSLEAGEAPDRDPVNATEPDEDRAVDLPEVVVRIRISVEVGGSGFLATR